jgi:hypothetical protein
MEATQNMYLAFWFELSNEPLKPVMKNLVSIWVMNIT